MATRNVRSASSAFTARSVIASTLLGVDPPRLPTRMLVRSGELFGIVEGTTRVAVSRMVAAGELEPDDDGHRLAGALLARQARQAQSRAPKTRRWRGTWCTRVVVADGRTADERSELRTAMTRLRMAELREGVWLRPDNLPIDTAPEARSVIDRQCRWMDSRVSDPRALATELWDLSGWSDQATKLHRQLEDVVGQLDGHDLNALAPAFVLSATVLRHLVADPLLPTELLPGDWPGTKLRATYDRYDDAFKSLWRDWYRRTLRREGGSADGGRPVP